MAAIALRNNIIGLVRTLASKEVQLAYERDVPLANVPAELVCMWFDDLYHPDGDLFLEGFNQAERNRLAGLHAVYAARVDQMPRSLAEMHRNAAWLEVMAEAQRVLDDLGWIAGR